MGYSIYNICKLYMRKKVVSTRKRLRMRTRKGFRKLRQQSKKRRGGVITTVPDQQKKITPYYDLTNCTNFFAFSDLEGANPFKFDDKDTVYDGLFGEPVSISELETENIITTQQVKNEVKSKIQTYFNVSNGCITGLITDTTAIAYEGDLLDNQVNFLTLLESMIKLKESAHDRVILIGGNRDFNKVRYGIELYIMNSDGSLPWTKPLSDFIEPDKNNIKFRCDTAPDYLTWFNNKDHEKNLIEEAKLTKFSESKTAVDRIAAIKPMFAFTPESIIKSIELTFTDDGTIKAAINNADKEPINRIICVLFMIMSFEWSKDTFQKDGWAIFEKYNGMLYKYLTLIQPIAFFKFNDNNGILTHRGYDDNFTIPLGEAPNDTNTLKLKTDNLQNLQKLQTDIAKIQDDWNRFISSYSVTYKESKNYYNKATDPQMYKWIQLGAPTTLIKTSKSPFSPSGTPTYTSLKDANITYNIFGHMPQLFFPSVNKPTDTNTYHICLDVCKADYGTSNSSYSFAMLHLSKTGDRLFGRTRLGNLKNKINESNESSKYEDKIIYYNNTLDDFITGINKHFNLNDENSDFKRRKFYTDSTYTRFLSVPEDSPLDDPMSAGGRKTRRKKHVCRTAKCRHHSHRKKTRHIYKRR